MSGTGPDDARVPKKVETLAQEQRRGTRKARAAVAAKASCAAEDAHLPKAMRSWGAKPKTSAAVGSTRRAV